jgi:hypothetical protein
MAGVVQTFLSYVAKNAKTENRLQIDEGSR